MKAGHALHVVTPEPVNESGAARTCGWCVACCVHLKVVEIGKPWRQACTHLRHRPQGHSCMDTNNCTLWPKPKVCEAYRCEWLKGWGDECDRPDRSGVIFDTVEGIANAVVAKPTGPLSDLAEQAILRMSMDRDVPVIVISPTGARIDRVVGKGQ